LATGIARLSLWQVPLVVLGLILLISLPSMVIAAIKLRQRTLGPLLEANGWAINGRVRISILFGRKLTAISKLPAGSKRSFRDPYKDRSKSRKRLIVWLILLFTVAAVAIYEDRSRRGHYFWQTDSEAEQNSDQPTVPPVED